MKRQGLKQNSMILLIATAISKILGVVFKIPLTNLLGGSGMGYFAGAYGIFIPVYTVICAGLPTALIRLVAKNCASGNYKTVRKLKKVATAIFLITGAVGTVLIIIFALPTAKHIAKNPDCVYALIMLSPSLMLCCLAAVQRGYYEGMSNMYPTAISQVCESIAKTLFGLLFTVIAIKLGMRSYENTGAVFNRAVSSYNDAKTACLPFAAAGAMLGSTFSELAGLIAVYIKTKFFGDGISKEEYDFSNKSESTLSIIKQLFMIAIPLTMGAVISAGTSFLDLASIMHGLNTAVQKDITAFSHLTKTMSAEEIPNFLYGSYTGLTGTVISFVPIVAGLLSKVALPEVSADCQNNNPIIIRRNIENIMEATLIFSVPSGFIICALSKQILTLLYPSRLLEISVSILPLSILGISAVFISIIIPVSSMLCAAGKEKSIIFLTLFSSLLELMLNILLVRIPTINIVGVAIATAVSNVITASISLFILSKSVNANLHFKRIFVFTFSFSGASTCLILLAKKLLLNKFSELESVVGALFLGVLCYFLLLFRSKVLKKADLQAFFMKKPLK